MAEEKFSGRRNSAVLGFYVMPHSGHWGTPLMLAALAGVVHERRALTASKATAVRMINNGRCNADLDHCEIPTTGSHSAH